MSLNKLANGFYDLLAKKIVSPVETKNKAYDSSEIDANFILSKSDKYKSLLDLGSGTGLILNKIVESFNQIVAIEKQENFTKFIVPNNNLTITNIDILNYIPSQTFDMITAFGVANFFDSDEANEFYKIICTSLSKDGIAIIKSQFALDETFYINYSEELGTGYFAVYRTVEKETQIIETTCLKVIEVVDIYPDNFNRHINSRFFALVLKHKV